MPTPLLISPYVCPSNAHTTIQGGYSIHDFLQCVEQLSVLGTLHTYVFNTSLVTGHTPVCSRHTGPDLANDNYVGIIPLYDLYNALNP
jgi:hypothetical protein